MNMKKLLCRGAYYLGILMMCSTFALIVIDVIDGRSQMWITSHIAAEILSTIFTVVALVAEPLLDHDDAIRELQDFKQALLNNARPEPQASQEPQRPQQVTQETVSNIRDIFGGNHDENNDR